MTDGRRTSYRRSLNKKCVSCLSLRVRAAWLTPQRRPSLILSGACKRLPPGPPNRLDANAPPRLSPSGRSVRPRGSQALAAPTAFLFLLFPPALSVSVLTLRALLTFTRALQVRENARRAPSRSSPHIVSA